MKTTFMPFFSLSLVSLLLLSFFSSTLQGTHPSSVSSSSFFFLLSSSSSSYSYFHRSTLLSANIEGAGATFPQPLYQEWAFAFSFIQPDIQVIYDGVGSGLGVASLTAQRVEWAGSDFPQSQDWFEEVRRVVRKRKEGDTSLMIFHPCL
jgi:ABC-type phosphate transport system substrate-binding protein